jgi:hypothetical protein
MPNQEKQTETANSKAGFIDEPEFLSRVPICRRSLKNWREQGKIPFVKIGRRVLYHWPSCEAALLRQQKGATP